MIIIVSLGTEKGDLSLRGAEKIRRADKVILKTGLLPYAETVKELGAEYETLDELFEKCRTGEIFAEKAAREIKRAAKNRNICYCVDGGVSEDSIAELLMADGGVEVVEAATHFYSVPLLERKRFTMEDLMTILRRLRAPDGCPWDRVQTHESIRVNAIEEAYELVDAIDCDDPEKICEEAGDVLMQAAFHTLIEEERGNFNLSDVVSGVCEKLITRHTHVFGKDKAAGADGALSVWDKNKMAEKRQATFSDSVNDVPYCFPALLRAQKVAKRTAKGGWEFKDFAGIETRLGAEIASLEAAREQGDEKEISRALGRALMCAVWLGRASGADCEQALLDEAKNMQARYSAYEKLVLQDGKDVNALSEAEKKAYYERAKQC